MKEKKIKVEENMCYNKGLSLNHGTIIQAEIACKKFLLKTFIEFGISLKYSATRGKQKI